MSTVKNATSLEEFIKGLPKPELSENAVTVLEKRYLRKDKNGKYTETPKELFARVAWHIAGPEEEDRESFAIELYDLMIKGIFMFNTPTLFNAGTGNGMSLTACHVLVPEDDLRSIAQVQYELMVIQQAGGGVGYCFDNLRPRGSLVKSCGANTDGPLPFIDAYCASTDALQQGAKRRGAQLGALSIWHPDIYDFIQAKSDLGRWQNMNVSIKVTDDWMKRLKKGGDEIHEVHHPEWGSGVLVRKRSGKVEAVRCDDLRDDLAKCEDDEDPLRIIDLWKEICERAWTTGEPGLLFWDRVEKDWVFPESGKYPMESPNPCGEQILENYGSCTLGSINLSKFVPSSNNGRREGIHRIDWEALGEAVGSAVKALDNVVEVNQFPVEKLAETNLALRRIGLGIMGWADTLFQLEIPYDSEEARDLAEELSCFISEEAGNASNKLAQKKGSFLEHRNSDYKAPMRNAYRTTCPPTGSISILCDTSAGIEPVFSLAFEREVMQQADGSRVKMTETNPHFVSALRKAATVLYGSPDSSEAQKAIYHATEYAAEKGTIRGFKGELSRSKYWPELIERVFQTARDISMEGHVLMQAAWQRYFDTGISKTCNLAADSSVGDVEKAYMLAWSSKCKGVTVYRDGCRDNIEGQVQPMKLKQTKEYTQQIKELEEEWTRQLLEKASDDEGFCCPICKGFHDPDGICPDEACDLAKYFPETELKRGQMEDISDIIETLKVKQPTPLGRLHVFLVHEGGDPKEIWGQIKKAGEQPAADLEAICRLASLVLRLGGTLDMVLKQLERIGSNALTPTANGKIMSIPDGLAVALKRAKKELEHADTSRTPYQEKEPQPYGEVCPDCGSVLYESSGCQSCTNAQCGYSRC